jgi:8-hydroxy-5-deazaflavin:NADPH oxidoreductase
MRQARKTWPRARSFRTKALMPVARDDQAAKEVVIKLAGNLGFEAVDAGPLRAARVLEFALTRGP